MELLPHSRNVIRVRALPEDGAATAAAAAGCTAHAGQPDHDGSAKIAIPTP